MCVRAPSPPWEPVAERVSWALMSCFTCERFDQRLDTIRGQGRKRESEDGKVPLWLSSPQDRRLKGGIVVATMD